MTYSSGGLIQAADYNTFQTNLNAIWGTGSTDSGWGQTAIEGVGTTGTTGTITSVVIVATAGVLTVTSGTYFVGQQILVSGTLSAGTINGTANYTTPVTFYIISVASATSITISTTPSGTAVATTAGTATTGGTFTLLAAASLVTATQWATLVNNLSTSGAQTNTALTARTAPTAGTVISVLSAVATDITSCTTNRGNAASSGAEVGYASGTTSKTTATGSGQAAWNIEWTHTVTFPSADQARYFWNAGGRVRLQFGKSSTGTDVDPDWNTFAGYPGSLYITGRVNSAAQTIAGVSYTGTTRIGGTGGTQDTLTTTTGWYQLTGVSTNIFILYNTNAPYTNEYILVRAYASGTLLTLITAWFQPAVTDPGTTCNISGGTAPAIGATSIGAATAPTTLCTYFPPSTAQGLSASWGTPTIDASVV
jgi:hypothetical protein